MRALIRLGFLAILPLLQNGYGAGFLRLARRDRDGARLCRFS
jgi:hypothetical protein